jgi:hypothetical protein
MQYPARVLTVLVKELVGYRAYVIVLLSINRYRMSYSTLARYLQAVAKSTAVELSLMSFLA